MAKSENQELIKKVEEIINQIRPYLEADGGNIRFVELTTDNIVYVELQGACATCPMSIMTLKNGVEEAVKKAIPEIKSVEAINLKEPFYCFKRILNVLSFNRHVFYFNKKT